MPFITGHPDLVSAEARQRAGKKMLGNKFALGLVPWNKGIKSPYSSWNKGLKMSNEHRKILSEAHLGQPAWNKNLKGYMAGEKHYNWQGGITPENQKTRHSFEYKLWQDAVLNRDHHYQKCDETESKKLVAHHILNFSIHKELRLVIDNGITFCKRCHSWFHRVFSRKNNNMEQIVEFLKPKICN